MGFTPSQVDSMSLWEFMACSSGYAEANGAKKEKSVADVSDETLRRMGIEGF